MAMIAAVKITSVNLALRFMTSPFLALELLDATGSRQRFLGRFVRLAGPLLRVNAAAQRRHDRSYRCR